MNADNKQEFRPPRNHQAWAVGTERKNGFHVRRVVWGLLMAQAEMRDGEEIRAARLYVERDYVPRRSVL
jgi:hypothetical protein